MQVCTKIIQGINIIILTTNITITKMAQTRATKALMNHAMVKITSQAISDGHYHHENRVHTTTLPDSPVHDNDNSGSNTPRHNRATSRRQGFGGIAFSAYLDHDVTLGQHQTLKFNKVLVNDGTGYSPNTGAFTCPEGGTYMFTFVIGQRDANHYMWAELVLNSANVIDAAVDTYHQYQDLQGGNTVILKLKQGDEVWVDATHSGSHVEGSTTLRLSTFTGLYLYS
ncbi:complement C1q subcomponent subunit B-like [Mya arenaria]|uniref:complement C1q subcomponent subunit B-like n=1 Tax=Mya arenaria TaxID=6604 RepID=UPI0022DFDA41|nr:complement C1q subcomponent subunit B-like [Mya arenaria]